MATPHGPRRQIGEILLEKGTITQEQLDEALNVQRNAPGQTLPNVLVDLGFASQRDVDRAHAEHLGYPYLDINETTIDKDAAKVLARSIITKHRVVPIQKNGGRLVVAIHDPTNVFAIDDIRLVTNFEVDPVLASEEDIDRLIQSLDGQSSPASGGDMQNALQDLNGIGASLPADPAAVEEEDNVQIKADDAPIIRVINVAITHAVQDKASDIHIEPERRGVRIRYRVDGVMHEALNLPKYLHAALLSRVKIMADLNIAERRLPQSGHIRIRHQGRDFDIRVETIPTIFGEKAVLRLLEQGAVVASLERLGLFPETQADLEVIIQQPHGIILSTGPTGHGKTTTQCAVLTRLVTPAINIMTVEDPVEYNIPGVNQVQVQRKAGLTFASALRSFLRLDPDIIMVGEIRDMETAETAIQASLTGHLVLSTLHTNDAPTAITRLIDMGIEPFLVSASLIGVLAQRLARRICKECKEAYKPPADALARIGFSDAAISDVTFYRGRGCNACRQTGYSGRIGIFELMLLNGEIRDLIIRRAPLGEIRAACAANGMKTLKEDGMAKVIEGITTIEEVMRVVFTAGE